MEYISKSTFFKDYKKLNELVGRVQFVVFEKFTSAYLFQTAREKSFDLYLLIIYMQKLSVAHFHASVAVRLLSLFGHLPLPCRSSLVFLSRTCFELLNSLSRMIKLECLFSLCARYRLIAVTITRRLSGS